MQAAGLRETDRAQVFDQSGQAVDLVQQAAELGFIGHEYAFGQSLQAAAQNGDRGAQLMGDGCVPESHFLGSALQLGGQRVEVVGQTGGFAQ
jgi:hypothetical protein